MSKEELINICAYDNDCSDYPERCDNSCEAYTGYTRMLRYLKKEIKKARVDVAREIRDKRCKSLEDGHISCFGYCQEIIKGEGNG